MDPLLTITTDRDLVARVLRTRRLELGGGTYQITAVFAMTKLETTQQCWSVRGRAVLS